ncbi:50S ribosomal protein L11 methyltransferase [Balneola sp. MJW-20]|uniref:50S ribosomal protein L11 methyltransferase n=1 Tax=Gracilimonas aurantiaca TaxID=3234185 RepID=UPI0034672211
MSEHLQLTIVIDDDLQEYLIADLFDMDFEGFEQLDNKLIATIPAARFDDMKREELERILISYGQNFLIEKEEILGEQNWNEEWEKTIQPQQIGDFYVHPTWSSSESTEGLTDLIIDPKLAFGTGYHPTTRLILKLLPGFIEEGDKVLDAGTGTGILGIAALKIGASEVLGFDIDEWSRTNATENILLNEVENFEVKLGSVETIPQDEEYDLILANINRNALTEMIPDLLEHLKSNGYLILSGLLKEDEEYIKKLDALADLSLLVTKSEDEWIAMAYRT